MKGFRVLQLVQAFVNREQATHAEQHERNDKTPEIAEFAVSQWVIIIRRPLRLPQANKQKDLIAAICIRMYRFSQHTARPGIYRSPCFRQRDAKISYKSIKNCLGR